jgi:hypothetical protein
MSKDTHTMVYQEKIAPPRREPADVLLCRRTIKSLEQENAWLKERLSQILRGNKVAPLASIFEYKNGSACEGFIEGVYGKAGGHSQ